ncbi:MAG: hypothetical protein WCO99_10985, partial [Planctomycetota bacterium]
MLVRPDAADALAGEVVDGQSDRSCSGADVGSSGGWLGVSAAHATRAVRARAAKAAHAAEAAH